MLAEGGKTSLMNNGFNLLYGWNFHSKLKDYYAGKCSLTDLYAMNTSELEECRRVRYGYAILLIMTRQVRLHR